MTTQTYLRDEPLIIVEGVSDTDFSLTFFPQQRGTCFFFPRQQGTCFFFSKVGVLSISFFRSDPLPFFLLILPDPPTMINGSSLSIKFQDIIMIFFFILTSPPAGGGPVCKNMSPKNGIRLR